MILLYAISGTPVHAGGNSDLINSYELVPANPMPDTPFELHIGYNRELALDTSNTSIVVDGNDITVELEFYVVICPPVIGCLPGEAAILIPGLTAGTYHMHIIGSTDAAPFFDASIDFVVGSAPLSPIPTLSESIMVLLILLLIAAGTLAVWSVRKISNSV